MTDKTDIKALIEQLKEAAEKATHGEWHKSKLEFNAVTNTDIRQVLFSDKKENIIATTSETRDAEFIALANPSSITLILDALEAAQQRITELEEKMARKLDSFALDAYTTCSRGNRWK